MAKKTKEEGDSVQSSTSPHHDHDHTGHGLGSDSSEGSCFEELSDTFLGSILGSDLQ